MENIKFREKTLFSGKNKRGRRCIGRRGGVMHDDALMNTDVSFPDLNSPGTLISRSQPI